MKLFVIGSDVPFQQDNQRGVTAVNIIVHEILHELIQRGHQIGFQIIFNQHQKLESLTPAQEHELRRLEQAGVHLFPAIYPGRYLPPNSSTGLLRKFEKVLGLVTGRTRLEDVYPSARLSPLLEQRIAQDHPDVILTLLSQEGVAATHGIRGMFRVAYHGDVDFMPAEARLLDPWLFPRTAVDRVMEKRRLAQVKRAHLRLMKPVDVIANVSACNAEFYRRQGHSCSVYVRNTWRDTGPAVMKPIGRPIKIIGHAGQLNVTGGSFGLKYLTTQLLPALEKSMAGLDYEIQIIGAGEPPAALKPMLRHPRIRLLGFVENLDQVLLSSDFYLLLNNSGPYQAAFTRHLIAWSMGLCLVVHANSRKAIPEISPANALVGSSPEEIAELIRLASLDQTLNHRARAGGRATFKQFFVPAAVVRSLEALWPPQPRAITA